MKKSIPTEIQGAQIPPYYPPPGLNPCFVWKPRDPKKRPCWQLSDEEKLNPPNGVLFDEEDLLQFAEGNVEPVFGPAYKDYDTYRRRTKLPGREYLLVSRVTSMRAKTNVFEPGATMTTEYDLPYNSELSEGGDVPWAVLVESGQCDLMLISYMGVDFQCRGDRVYRLLDTTLTFYGVAREGETLKYDIQVNGFAKNPNGDISIFFFSYNCYCNGKLLIEMRNGAAGFFTDEELAAGKGVIKTVGDRKARAAIKKQDITPYVIAKPSRSSFNEQDMQALVRGEWGTVMDGNAGRAALRYKLCSKKVLMIDRITHIDHKAGAYGLGFLVGEKILAPDMWFFPCHFPGDQVMAGSLVSDGCSQMLKTYMIWLGLHSLAGENPLFRPVPGNPNKVRCRGQISPHKGKLVYCMEIRSIGIDAEGCPFAIADVDIIDVNTELGQSFDINDMDSYGNGDLNKKIVVDFKGIALRIERGPVNGNGSAVATPAPASSLAIQGVLQTPVPPPIKGMKLGEPGAPSQVTWHPLYKTLGSTPLNFYPSKFAPREICFTPFDASKDTNREPGKFPMTWWHLCEFMCGKVSNCLGAEFARFDVSKTSRSPAFDLQMVTRVLGVEGMVPKKVYGVDVDPSQGSMVAEFDCPKDAWFFKGASQDCQMPYSVLMEIGLQTSGVLTSVLKAPLTMNKDDILFRNLDASTELNYVPDLRGVTIVNKTRCTGYSMMGTMGVHKFHFELFEKGKDKPFYVGDTSFGWFTPEVFESQVGLDSGQKSECWHVVEKVPTNSITTYDLHNGRSKLFGKLTTDAHLGRRSAQSEYLDIIDVIPNSGKFGKGYAHGKKTVVKEDWFFSCHFWNDPVMPGSLGVESMFQAIEAYCIHENVAAKFGIKSPAFNECAGKTQWKYRGQLTPKNDQMDCEVHIKSIEADGKGGVEVVADGFLFVDRLRVYATTSLRLRIETIKGGNGQAPTLNIPLSAPSNVSKLPISSPAELKAKLLNLTAPLYLADEGKAVASGPGAGVEEIFSCTPKDLGDKTFMQTYGVDLPLYTGAMAKGIASADLVIACGKRKILSSLGAGGLPLQSIVKALDKIQAELPNGPYMVNLIHSPFNENLEKGCVDLLLQRGVHFVEASAFMNVTIHVVRYRLKGLQRGGPHGVIATNRLIAKISRTELAEMFVRPAPEALVKKLLEQGDITAEQAELSKKIPLCDDIAVEADSGGHTDNRPLVVILPMIIAVRDKVHKEMGYPAAFRVRVGAGGGIGCPQAVMAAFQMGAAFAVTGTINQMSRQSGSSDIVRGQLSKATYSDITMAPAADMFDQGVQLQVLKKGTMFAARAKKLYELFVRYESLDEIPAEERKKLEQTIFRKEIDVIWKETADYYINVLKDEAKILQAGKDPKLKMSLVFRWYLGLSSTWANSGVADRATDYQVWCGPAIGAFNDFIRGTYLDPEVAKAYPDVAQINLQLFKGACYLKRLRAIQANPKLSAVDTFDGQLSEYRPDGPM